MNFKYTLDNKRYHTLNYYYKQKYGKKVFKICLDAGFSCPNIDKGNPCIYCNCDGSAAFPLVSKKGLLEQFAHAKSVMDKKWTGEYIAYFQAHTNTYAPVSILREKFDSVLDLDNVVGLTIATRCDAISEEVFTYLEELNKKTNLTIELGLQSSNEKTTDLIQRGHSLDQFKRAVRKLKSLGIEVCVHIINGLPFETKKNMLETILYLNKLGIDGLKIHMLYIEKDTAIAKLYEDGVFSLLTKDEYIDIVVSQLELLDPQIVIHRITGDPDRKKLIAPTWLLKKTVLINDIDKEMVKRDSWQGKRAI